MTRQDVLEAAAAVQVAASSLARQAVLLDNQAHLWGEIRDVEAALQRLRRVMPDRIQDPTHT